MQRQQEALRIQQEASRVQQEASRIQQGKERKEREERATSTQTSSGRVSKRNSKYND